MNEEKLLLDVVNMKEDIANIKEDISNINTKLESVDTILSTLDEIKGMLNKHDTEQASTKHALSRHEVRIERLEKIHEV